MDDAYVATVAGIAMGLFVGVALFALAIVIFYGYCMGRIFRKAGRPLWAGFIPVYNIYVWIEIVGRPTWWIILMLIPLVGTVIQVFLAIDLARSFGKDEVFGVLLLWLFSFIGLPMLAFNDDEYKGPSVANPNSLVQQ